MGGSLASMGGSSGDPSNIRPVDQDEIKVEHILTPDMVERCWNDQDAPCNNALPWETGIWARIFTNKDLSFEFDGKLQRLPPVPLQLFRDDSLEPGPKRIKLSSASHWSQVVANTDVKTWKEDTEAKLATSLNRWYDVIIQFPSVCATVQQLGAIKSIPDQMRMLRDILVGKSPLTLTKRANSMLRYVEFLRTSGATVPGTEENLYKFFCDERLRGSPASRLQGVVEAIRFTEHVFGIDGLCAELLSKRCIGAAKSGPSQERLQACPLTVEQLVVFHETLHNEDCNFWDRLVCGSILAAVYSRSRWADMQHTDCVDFDPNSECPVYIEMKIKEFKTKKANAWRGGILVAVAPAVGVVASNWAQEWWKLRSSLDAPLSGGFPVMPAPDSSGAATLRPLSSAELSGWMRLVLGRHSLIDDAKRISSHSCKATLLSYLAKWGADVPTREILGGHSARLQSVLTYSRDSLGAPLRTLDSMLKQVRLGMFQPDALRSGRFVAPEIDAEQEQRVDGVQCKSEVISDTDQDQPESKLFPGCCVVESSSSEEGDTSSSSDGEGASNSHAARLVSAPRAPNGTCLRQHRRSHMLHLLEDGFSRVLMCGRNCSDAYIPPAKLRWDTACCNGCWRAAKVKLGPRVHWPLLGSENVFFSARFILCSVWSSEIVFQMLDLACFYVFTCVFFGHGLDGCVNHLPMASTSCVSSEFSGDHSDWEILQVSALASMSLDLDS